MPLYVLIIAAASSGLFFLLGVRLGVMMTPPQAYESDPDPSPSASLRLGCYALVDVDSILRSFFTHFDGESIIDSDAIILGRGRELLALSAPKSENSQMSWAA